MSNTPTPELSLTGLIRAQLIEACGCVEEFDVYSLAIWEECLTIEGTIESLQAENKRLTEALRYTAYYGSSVPLGMTSADYYRGAMNDLIKHAAIALDPK